MAPSEPPTARARVLADVRRALAVSDGNASGPKVPPLQPGQMRLRSFVAPPLTAGDYEIKVEQKIKIPGNSDLNLSSTQSFLVSAPKYSLPADAIHQIYPPQGHEDHHLILPHVVLEDWMLAWEQEPPQSASTKYMDPKRLRVPWLALLTFTEDDIGLADDEMVKLGLTSGDGKPLKQNKTSFSVDMTLGDALKASKASTVTGSSPWITPVRDDDPLDPIDPSSHVDMIFVKNGLFNQFFGTDRQQQPGGFDIPSDKLPDLSRYAYLAHAREINTTKMANAGVEDEGQFGIIISQRSGPMLGQDDHPVAIQCHLVSLLGLVHPEMQMISDSSRRIGLVSLHSWTYSCLPPEKVDFRDKMRTLGRQLDPALWTMPTDVKLAASAKIQGTQGWLRDPAAWMLGPDPIPSEKAQRMFLGFDMARFQTSTGEPTIACIKGALEPTMTRHPIPNLPTCVNSSMTLAQFDDKLGAIDLTYSAAWELGRALAIADRAFAAALVRLRRTVHVEATQMTVLSVSPAAMSKHQIIAKLSDMVKGLESMPDDIPDVSDRLARDGVAVGTGVRPLVSPSIPPHTQTDLRPIFHAHARTVVQDLASSSSPSSSSTTVQPMVGTAASAVYNEHNKPTNSDWAMVLKWVMDRLYLYNIPAHYLIGDPSKLPPDSIRFFYIDNNWTDSLIDGALSIGNHFDREVDTVRLAIKEQINTYLKTPIDSDKHPYPPQVPCFGFFIRSDLIQAVPNLQVHAPWPKATDTRSETLRLETIASDVLLCLLDRLPGSSEYSSITLEQPPHQQRFRVGMKLAVQSYQSTTEINYIGYSKKIDMNAIDIRARKRVDKNHAIPPATLTGWGAMAYDGSDLRWWQEFWRSGFDRIRLDEVYSTYRFDLGTKMIYDFPSRCMIPRVYGRACRWYAHDTRQINTVDDIEPDPAFLAYQLNDPIFRLKITMPRESPDTGEATASPRPSSPRSLTLPLDPHFQTPPETVISDTLATNASAAGVPGRLYPATTVLSGVSAAAPTTGVSSLAVKTPWPPAYAPGRSILISTNPSPNPASPSPHPMALPTATVPTAVTGAGATATPTANLSSQLVAECKFWQAGRRPTDPNAFNIIEVNPGDHSLPVDLVFSITFPSDPSASRAGVAGLEDHIHSIRIIIPQAAGSPGGYKPDNVIERYDGPGAQMLGNLRWNIELGVASPYGVDSLSILLTPRCQTSPNSGMDMCKIKNNPSMSFILYGARLNSSGTSGSQQQGQYLVAQRTDRFNHGWAVPTTRKVL